MRLPKIAYKNIKQNINRYIAYIFSMAFTVMVYFMYKSLVDHPGLSQGFAGASAVKSAMQASAVVIAGFTFIFLSFSSSSFLRSRKKEFGLLSLLGMSKGQISALVIWENIFVGLMALGLGIGFGLVFQKLFLMAISALIRLESPLAFYVSKNTIKQTTLVFSSLFFVVAIFSLGEILRSSLVDLIKASKRPKNPPTFSKIKAFLGLFLVVVGYGLASVPLPEAIPVLVLPVTIIVCIGTYMSLREASVWFLSRLRKNKKYFYTTSHLLNVSQLSYKMKDNYKTMSAVAILIAVILTALGTIYSFFNFLEADILFRSPHHFELTGQKADLPVYTKQIAQILEEEKVETEKDEITALQGVLENKQEQVVILPYSYYKKYRQKPLPINDHEAIISDPNIVYFGEENKTLSNEILKLLKTDVSLETIYFDSKGSLLNAHYSLGRQLIVTDSVYEQIKDQAETDNTYIYWQAKNWQDTSAIHVAKRIINEIKLPETPKNTPNSIRITTTPDAYEAGSIVFGTAIFIGFFITLVFFAACCSLLYFRLFTDIEEDRKYYLRLRELGLTEDELKKISLKQVLVIFLVPYGIGILHSFFALSALATMFKALGHLTKINILTCGLTISFIYLSLYTLYFFGAFGVYWKGISKKNI